jgi:hypothetical protein
MRFLLFTVIPNSYVALDVDTHGHARVSKSQKETSKTMKRWETFAKVTMYMTNVRC